MAASERLGPPLHRPVPVELDEDWNPGLSRVRSIDQAMAVLPAYIHRERGSRDARIASGIDRFIRDRFFHQTSLLSFRENWLAALSGFVWINLRMPVLPDDILQHRRAICSQQSIVFMELLRRYGLHRAAVMMDWPSPDPASRGHFAVAAQVDGQWMYFDPDEEPQPRSVPYARLVDGSAVATLYAHRPQLLPGVRWAAAHHRIRLGHIDADPAPRGGLFERVTGWASAWGWIPLALLALLLLWRELQRPGRRRRIYRVQTAG